MSKVFVSYSHRDAEFVDRLVQDLLYSDVQATYDKWLLRVGDSIIHKIAEVVTEADKVIVVVSKASVKSPWVAKELSLALTTEINGKSVRVLPAVIDNCTLPATLSDKLFADFRKSYYWGLDRLLDAVDPRGEERRWGRRRRTGDEPRQIAIALEGALATTQADAVRGWARKYPSAALSLLGHRWSLSEAITDFRFGTNADQCDLFIANGQSFRFEFLAVRFGPPSLASIGEVALADEASAIQSYVNHCVTSFEEFCRAASIRFSEDQIAPPSLTGYPERFSHRHQVKAVLFAGRRDEHARTHNALRESIQASIGVEIASYDRLLDAIVARSQSPG